MRVLFLIFFCFFISGLFAQKQTIDSTAYRNWTTLGYPSISDDGKYMLYSIDNPRLGRTTLALHKTDGTWEREYFGIRDAWFSPDSKSVFFNKNNDSLGIITLNTGKLKYVLKPASDTLKIGDGCKWQIYLRKNDPKFLVIKNLTTKKENVYDNVISQTFSESKNLLVIQQKTEDWSNLYTLKYLDIAKGNASEIFRGDRIGNLALDEKHEQLVFTKGDSLMYYKWPSLKATCLIKSISELINADMVFGGITNFTKDGGGLFVLLTKNKKIKPKEEAVEVWSYLDVSLQSEQKNESPIETCSGMINLSNKRVLFLEQKKGDQLLFPTAPNASDTLVLIRNEQRLYEKWSLANEISTSLLNVKTGVRTRLDFLDENRTVSISPSGKYLIYYNSEERDYFSYEIKTKKIRNLTDGLMTTWVGEEGNDRYDHNEYPRDYTNIRWSENDAALFIYDSNDIWRVDPLNRSKPINLTNGYGKKHHIILSFAVDFNKEESTRDNYIYLTAFNTETKASGFYSANFEKARNPKLLFMGQYIFSPISSYKTMPSYFSPIKAKIANVFVVRRMSAKDAPNYFSTGDFKTFVKLSDIQPQKDYNWYTSEIHKWKSLNGDLLSGVLYKPENFDANKKYPVIFYYYERLSDGLNCFLHPEPSYAGLDIPTYVSNEYLIFCPDIYYEIGNPMQGTYDAIVSAASYVSSLSFVNSKRMGIQGQSFGGIQTNYILSHTNIFAAACSTAGFANWISSYGALFGDGRSLQYMFEYGQLRMAGTPWEMPGNYIKNSALLNAYKITTPLLLLNNHNDPSIPYSDAIAFFTSLRRLGKRAWLLSYPNGEHQLVGKDAYDFSIRMMQFFNHYLKDNPAPIWMTRGIPAFRRGLDSGLAYDKQIMTPGIGLLKPKEQAKVDSLMIEGH